MHTGRIGEADPRSTVSPNARAAGTLSSGAVGDSDAVEMYGLHGPVMADVIAV